MAKGSPFWGKQKGKLGETVLAVVKGQQVQRAYNGEPTNPRSNKQTAQRIVFANAVKFFKSAIASQFKFAYEDKKQTESDYNAFMRHNVKNGNIIARDMYLDPNYPSVGEFILSDGSISEIMPSTAQGTSIPTFNFKEALSTAPTTLQGLATALKDTHGLADGDILTFVDIKSGAYDLTTHPTSPLQWKVLQVKVGDATDTRTIASVSSIITLSAGTDNVKIIINGTEAEGCAIIVSRPTASGLKVSTSRVWYNGITKNMITDASAESYVKYAKNSWGMGMASLLEGSQLPNV